MRAVRPFSAGAPSHVLECGRAPCLCPSGPCALLCMGIAALRRACVASAYVALSACRHVAAVGRVRVPPSRAAVHPWYGYRHTAGGTVPRVETDPGAEITIDAPSSTKQTHLVCVLFPSQAFWNSPDNVPDHAHRACASALEQQVRLCPPAPQRLDCILEARKFKREREPPSERRDSPRRRPFRIAVGIRIARFRWVSARRRAALRAEGMSSQAGKRLENWMSSVANSNPPVAFPRLRPFGVAWDAFPEQSWLLKATANARHLFFPRRPRRGASETARPALQNGAARIRAAPRRRWVRDRPASCGPSCAEREGWVERMGKSAGAPGRESAGATGEAAGEMVPEGAARHPRPDGPQVSRRSPPPIRSILQFFLVLVALLTS